ALLQRTCAPLLKHNILAPSAASLSTLSTRTITTKTSTRNTAISSANTTFSSLRSQTRYTSSSSIQRGAAATATIGVDDVFSTPSHETPTQQHYSLAQPNPIFEPLDTFANRHIGPSEDEIATMCKFLNVKDLDHLVELALPASILTEKPTNLGPPVAETEVLERLKEIANKNKLLKSFIGMGYYGTVTPPVILRNILENPQWYTQVIT
ncbi:hypothetical protein HK102_009216, partial [Quaeritorhiza haematococci]